MKRQGIIVEITMIVVIVGLVVVGMVKSYEDGKIKGNEKLKIVRQHLSNMKWAFDNNISLSCENKRGQVFDYNVSKLNGYTMDYSDQGVLQDITFSKENMYFKEKQCEVNGFIL